MVKVLLLLFGILICQTCSNAAPSEPSEMSSPVAAANDEEEGGGTLDREPHTVTPQTNEKDANQNQRQKRFYDYIGFDYPPYDIPATFSYRGQSSNSKRDDSKNTAIYGTEDALSVIFRRLHGIVNDVRHQSAPRPAQTTIPALIPLFYIPQFDCGCNSNKQGPAPPVYNPTPQPSLPTTSSVTPFINTDTTVKNNLTFDNRGGFDGGMATNKPDTNFIGDGRRPINFDPIPPEEPMDVEVPPVDHGTVQAGAGLPPIPNQTTLRPQTQTNINFRPNRPVLGDALPTSSPERNFVPSLCDGAIISCCNRPQITEKCFESLGCEDPNIYGNPCDPNVQLSVINKFQYFQKRRAG